MLGMYAEHNFEGIVTGGESWFRYSSDSDLMFAHSRESVAPRIRQDISAPKTMIPIFFTSRRLLVLGTLPKGTKFNQDYFIQSQWPPLERERREFHAERASRPFQSTGTIRCAIMVAKALRNLPREALNEPHTYLILQTLVRATFGCLGFSSTT
jgi:hypothetical protein